MNLIDDQVVQMKMLTSIPSQRVLVIIVGNTCSNAIYSLREQVFPCFDVQYIRLDLAFAQPEGIIDVTRPTKNLIFNRIMEALKGRDEEWVYFLDGDDMLAPNAIFEFLVNAEIEKKFDIFYTNEAVNYLMQQQELDYIIKPYPTSITYLQSLYIGKSIFWKKNTLEKLLLHVAGESLDFLLKELFVHALSMGYNVGFFPKILLIRSEYCRDLKKESRLLPTLQTMVEKNMAWKGRLGRTSSYGSHSYELIDTHKSLLEKAGFIMIVSDVALALQLISQLQIFCAKNELLVAVKKDDSSKIEKKLKAGNFRKATVIEYQGTYTELLQKMTEQSTSPYQVIISESVQWINRMNMERFLNIFLKPEVMIAVPQVATEGDTPKLIYAGAGIDNLALNGSYFFGRSQCYHGEQDMAWTNYEVSMLTPYCIAARKSVWKDIFPLHKSITTQEQFTNELSFLCLEKNIICEYSAQSAVWIAKDIGGGGIKDNINGAIRLSEISHESRLSGAYWHWLCEFGNIIMERKGEIPDLYRSYNRHMKEDFSAHGIQFVKESGKMRVLVLTHELSLTGAPLVLVQAVKTLVKLNFDVLVVSPEDGPLRETYTMMEVPVIIDPQLQSDFSYMKMVLDFHFVIVSTIVLWQCIEALGVLKIPVLWWIHDSRIGYENYLRYVLPETVEQNIFIYCGGDYAQKVVQDYRPKYKTNILLYGLEDFSKTIPTQLDRNYWELPKNKRIFANIGQIMPRKGQDILVEAIEQLPNRILEQSAFVFVGSVVDKKIFQKIETLREMYPENVFYIKQMSYNELKEFYREVDGIICSSVDDPLPAFVAEAMMMSSVCICSRNTAFNSIIDTGVNGYLFESGNSIELSEKICTVVLADGSQDEIRGSARKLYEDTFAPEIFEKNFSDIIFTKLL